MFQSYIKRLLKKHACLVQVSDSDDWYRQCMDITDTYAISKGKLVHEIKMYESGMLELSLHIVLG